MAWLVGLYVIYTMISILRVLIDHSFQYSPRFLWMWPVRDLWVAISGICSSRLERKSVGYGLRTAITSYDDSLKV